MRIRPVQPGGAAVVSVVIPFYQEEESVRPVIMELEGVLEELDHPWEIVAVDDGSSDATLASLLALAAAEPRLRVVRMRRNSGQTAAMQAGFDRARGQVVISMDGDGQNDPVAIPDLLARIDEGYDLVCGWRAHRQDRWLSRKLPSRLANGLIAWVTGIPIHDNGCSLKAYRTDLLRRIRLYGEQHRFIPSLAALHGARIFEVKVPHRARQAGHSKYGLSRTYKVLLDLCTVRLLRPLAVAPAVPFMVAGAAAAAAGGMAVMLAWVSASVGQPVVVWSGVALLFSYLAGYLFILAFLSELLRQVPASSGPGPMAWRRLLRRTEQVGDEA